MTGRVTMLGLSRWAEKGGSYRTVQRFFKEKTDCADLAQGRGPCGVDLTRTTRSGPLSSPTDWLTLTLPSLPAQGQAMTPKSDEPMKDIDQADEYEHKKNGMPVADGETSRLCACVHRVRNGFSLGRGCCAE